jgi:1-acyl-sn-glycerol-3-phosphate acyltransferase
MLKQLFFTLIVRPVLALVSGVRVIGRERLPETGACILAANHNSHLDAPVLMSLFPLSRLKKVRPVAAADYFLKNRWRAWVSRHLMDIIPLPRRPSDWSGDPLAGAEAALASGAAVIIFPEGSRGEPESLAPFHSGAAHLAKRFPGIPVFPVHLSGAGRSLPKNEALFVPFIIDVRIGEPLYYGGEGCGAFTRRLEQAVGRLHAYKGDDHEHADTI